MARTIARRYGLCYADVDVDDDDDGASHKNIRVTFMRA